MNIEELRDYCLNKANTFDCFPFDQDTMVFKLKHRNGKDKIFAITSLNKPNYIMLKCNPERAIELRDQYTEIEAAYHMNKKHWNGVYTDGTIPRSLIESLIDHSYELVCK